MPRPLPAHCRPYAAASVSTRRLPALGCTVLLATLAFFFTAPAASRAQTPAGVDPKLVFYTHGDPSPDEQYLLELINFARANPTAEGQMLAGVTDPEVLRYYSHYALDTDKLRSDFASYPARAPLGFNSRLMVSSRTQSLDQATHGFQSHNGTDGSTFDGRITTMGYQWRSVGENVYAYAESAFFGHVGLTADWGVPQFDHRQNLMNYDTSLPVFKEIGISGVASSQAGFGPLVITQDFGTPATDTAFLVGVAYNDTDGNGFYTAGEGLAGTVVTSPQSSYYTITSASGGYTLPLDLISGGTSVQVTFGDGRGGVIMRDYPCGNNVTDNIKADLVSPVFASPTSVAMTAPGILNAIWVKDANRTTLKAGKLRIIRDGTDLSQDLTVHYEVSGNAVAGQDYAPLQGWVSIPAGKSSAAVKVHPLTEVTIAASDADGSGDAQTVTITLASVDQDPQMPMGATQASLTIN